MTKEPLPILERRGEIIAGLNARPRLIVHAPTGAGKSTQVPQIVLDAGLAGRGRIVVLQPRRLPARLLAARVAEERGEELGGEVGYQMRFDDRSGPATRIIYATEGVLLRRMISDPNLEGIACLVFDEFHERNLQGDVSLALARGLQETERPDLKLIVMSATLQAGVIEDYLRPASVVRAEGRRYPVAIEYLERAARRPVWAAAAGAFERIARQGLAGHVLVFMPGLHEIRKTVSALRASDAARELSVLPLHGELPPSEQDAAVARSPAGKIVVATNVAETSVTIDGITAVIDSGLARVPRFDPRRGINTLWIEPISRASADQRAGRAGRTAPGRCIRLWTERDHAARAAHELPEVKRIDLTEVVLALRALGVRTVSDFPWIEAPEPRALEYAEALLGDLGAVEPGGGAITDLGRRMLSFPVHPRYARMLLEAGELACVGTVALIAALTQERRLVRPGAGEEAGLAEGGDRSDFFPLVRAWEVTAAAGFSIAACRALGVDPGVARRVGRIRDHFLRIAEREGLPREKGAPPEEHVRRCVLAGFSDQLARRAGEGKLRCDGVHGRRGTLARESCVRGQELFVASEIREVEGAGGKGGVRLSMATAVEASWLESLFPADCKVTEELCYDVVQNRVVARRSRLFRDLLLSSDASPQVPLDAAAAILAEEVLGGRLSLRTWDEAAEAWIARVNCLAAWRPEYKIAPFCEEDRRAVIEQACWGSTSGKEIRDKPVMPVLKAWYSPAIAELIDRMAPERIRLPSGRNVKVAYREGSPPVVSARIQDLYGVEGPLTVAGGAVRILVHVLAPNWRAVHVTDDLTGFWETHYPRLKQELKRRYYKHEWR